MVLLIDIGNTNIVMGCAENNNILFRERFSTNHTATKLEYSVILKTAFEMHGVEHKKIQGAIISSVVPAVTPVVKGAINAVCAVEAMIVGPGMKTGLSIVIDNPAQLGSDLVVDAVACLNEYPVPMIIIDMGTATTVSVIDSQKRYLGGAILPGLAISHDALVSRTSLLTKIAFEAPGKVIGSNTVDSIKSGLVYGTAGTIDGLIDRMSEELGEKCTIIATGGLAHTVIPLCKNKIIIDDDLLLKGLMIIYNKNR